MLFTQAAKLEPRFCSGDYRPFLATPKLQFPCSFVNRSLGNHSINIYWSTTESLVYHTRMVCDYRISKRIVAFLKSRLF
jgi:hypothetical protein